MVKMMTVAEARFAVEESKAKRLVADEAIATAQEALREARQAVHRAEGQLLDALKRESANAIARDRREAQQLAKRWRFEIEKEDFADGATWWVWPPEGLYAEEGEGDPQDPFCGCRSCIAWSEIIEIARVYAKDAAAKDADFRAAH